MNDTAKMLSDIIKVTGNMLPRISIKSKNTKSISRRVKETGVMQFPMLSENTLSIEELSMAGKATERQNASWVAIICSVNSITNASNPADYIKDIHRNIQPDINNIKSGINESVIIDKLPLDHSIINEMKQREQMLSSIFETGAIPFMTLDKNEDESNDLKFTKSIIDDEDFFDDFENDYKNEEDVAFEEISYKKLNQDERKEFTKIISNAYPNKTLYKHHLLDSLYINKEDNVIPTDKFDCENLSQLIVLHDNLGNIKIKEAKIKYPKNINEYKEVFKPFNESQIQMIKDKSVRLLNEYKSDLNHSILNDKVKNNKNIKVFFKNKQQQTLSEALSVGVGKPLSPTNTKTSDKIFIDGDVKKANELAPTLLNIQTFFRTPTGDLTPVNYVIGVKSVIHPLSTDDITNLLVKSATSDSSKLLRFIKWTTGEISFFKDFLLCMDIMKDTIKDNINGHPWLSVLNKKSYSNKNMIPNASLVVSLETITRIKYEHGLDLTIPKNVKKLMNAYNFLSFMILDSSSETAYIMNDSDTSYARFSYNSLERENSNNSKDIKNIMNVLSKM